MLQINGFTLDFAKGKIQPVVSQQHQSVQWIHLQVTVVIIKICYKQAKIQASSWRKQHFLANFNQQLKNTKLFWEAIEEKGVLWVSDSLLITEILFWLHDQTFLTLGITNYQLFWMPKISYFWGNHLVSQPVVTEILDSWQQSLLSLLMPSFCYRQTWLSLNSSFTFSEVSVTARRLQHSST